MRGMKSEDLLAILDFLYCGETNVYQENLDSFLAIAEEFELKGLGKSSREEEIPTKPLNVPVAENPAFKVETISTEMASPQGKSRDPFARTVALGNEHSSNMQELDEQIKPLMTKSSRKTKHGQFFYVCNVS